MPKLGNARRAYGSAPALGNLVHKHLKPGPACLTRQNPRCKLSPMIQNRMPTGALSQRLWYDHIL